MPHFLGDLCIELSKKNIQILRLTQGQKFIENSLWAKMLLLPFKELFSFRTSKRKIQKKNINEYAISKRAHVWKLKMFRNEKNKQTINSVKFIKFITLFNAKHRENIVIGLAASSTSKGPQVKTTEPTVLIKVTNCSILLGWILARDSFAKNYMGSRPEAWVVYQKKFSLFDFKSILPRFQ